MDRNHRMELQYEGTGLHGWAKQDGLRTVEGCLEDAFRTVLGSAPAMRVAGRTDAGVHARRQVASACLPEGLDLGKLHRSLNALTPDGIAVLDLRRAPATFDARGDATSRTYRYFVRVDPVASPFWAGYCWQLPGHDLELAAMAEAAALVEGRHRFTAFTPTETKHVFFDRTVLRCRWTRAGGAALPGSALGDAAQERGEISGGVGRGRTGGRHGRAHGMLCLEIEADAFVRHMVRALVGTMIEVGRGERSLDDFRRLLEGAPRETAGVTAPPHGLFLWDIKYDRGRSKRPLCGRIPNGAGDDAGGAPREASTEDTADSEA